MIIRNVIILLTALVFVLTGGCSQTQPGEDVISLEEGWKIHKGDDPAWAEPGLDDSNWKDVDPNQTWELQDLQAFGEYDGYAWYRIRFMLPEALRKRAYFGEEIQFTLGRIDDTDQTYLNGQLLGQNAELAEDPDAEPGDFEGDPEAYRYFRNYVLPADDPRVRWGEENVLAIRVHDHGGGGGITNPSPSVSMVDIKDVLEMDVQSEPFEIVGNHYTKSIRLINSHGEQAFEGELNVRVTRYTDGEKVFESAEDIMVPADNQFDYFFSFEAPQTERYKVEYIFNIDGARHPVSHIQGAPYILTPPAPDEPRINGPSVFGVRPGHPLLYTIPVSGKRPMQFAVGGLPEGVVLDSVKGFLRGEVARAGEYELTLIAENALGRDEKDFTLKVGDTIQLTPPMGWNSWNCWGLSVSDEKVRSSARAMVESGLVHYGWSFINIDDGWEASERTGSGELPGNEKFPDMKALSDYVHGLGLKLGIYSSPGPRTCGGYPGSYQHEYQDARTWARWGIDYLKYDWCSYREIAESQEELDELQRPYLLMRDALDRVDRDIVYSLCQYGMGDVWEWGAEVGGNLWRTTGDIRDTWESLSTIGFSQYNLFPYSHPGHYNDPDMMILGRVGWGPDLHPTRLTADEQYTHVSLWCLLSAPLLLGNDLARLDDFTLSLLTNHEVLAINQDPLCRQAERVVNQDSIQVWVKPLEDGSHAAGFFNLDDRLREETITLESFGFEGTYQVRDLWRQEDMGEVSESIDLTLMPHGVYLVRLTEAD